MNNLREIKKIQSDKIVNSINIDQKTLEKVMIENDLSGLNSIEKVGHIKNVCISLGLNPLTRPIQLIKFQNGKEQMYCTKDATEQLRKNNNVSITKVEGKIIHNDIYVVTATAQTPSGRIDSSTGCISISNLKGELLSNAIMKCETKAKRRVTLSICGLGFLDESELHSIPNAKRVNVYDKDEESKKEITQIESFDDSEIQEFILDICQCNNLKDLENSFTKAYKHFVGLRDMESIRKIIESKDKKKNEINLMEFNEEIKESELKVKEEENESL